MKSYISLPEKTTTRICCKFLLLLFLNYKYYYFHSQTVAFSFTPSLSTKTSSSSSTLLAIDYNVNDNDTDYSNLKLHKVYLRQKSTSSSNSSSIPWCYALTVDPTITTTHHHDDDLSSSSPSPPLKYNFLASQVWPSARVAAKTCETYVQKHWKVCELGCGPALPSLTMMNVGVKHVVATDIDNLALYMTMKAAKEQNFCCFNNDNHNQNVEQEEKEEIELKEKNPSSLFETKNIDLTGNVNVLDNINADLYILSDVFETNHVAIGAAKMAKHALESGARVWVFAQSDRAQREVFREELRKQLLLFGHDYDHHHCSTTSIEIDGDDINKKKNEFDRTECIFGDLQWKFVSQRDFDNDKERLLLCDLDEILVDYG